MNEHLAFLRKRLHYAENDLKSVIASFDVGLRTVTDVTNAQKMTDDARTELELYQKGTSALRSCLLPTSLVISLSTSTERISTDNANDVTKTSQRLSV
ncbi:hypothetical protein CDAR_372061 [Caerostris darwini]|uniref:Uncharacterized protein n=1 Tax=Caerostris darwini TaxID=1538125 RepID=A0AAV4VXW3_9ARAC|nr:hypothetical protein CDAR_372061 [Caerostris darwini]